VPRPLFVYGSLMLAEVLDALLARQPCMDPAQLAGWSARCLRSVGYPGLVEDPAGVVPGLVVFDLTAQEAAIVDEWESDFYAKEVVRPVVVGGAGVDADAYVLRDPHAIAQVEARTWTVDVLLPEIDEYCRQTRAFRQAWLQQSRPD
jgi:gamma-glutamylcyclotransferase (GGCT)/AIG2-like uncharacterized protein YtfP